MDFILFGCGSAALINQMTIRRAAEYRQPDWAKTTEALRGGMPANIADLHTLVIEQLLTLKNNIRHLNTDPYKAYWRCDSKGHIESPEIEDICRDRLIDMLRPFLNPLNLRAEPEGHMAVDKRADIVIMGPPGQKLPLELKRDTHRELWTACANQLERLYTRDPEATGYGIYVVFWFGTSRTRRIPNPPDDIAPPETAIELELSLRNIIPTDDRHRLDVVVLDVTPPV